MTDAAPEDGARFRQALRGYDKADVDGAVKSLKKQIAELTSQRDDLAGTLAAHSGVPADYDQFALEVAGVLKAAEEAAGALTAKTEVEVTELLEQAKAEAASIVDQARAEAEVAVANAEDDVRIVRAEAEREAHRLVAAAKKEADDVLRVARMESERLHTDATTESDRMLGEAREAADAAQARAHALEVRRDELLSELESVRSTVSRLEGEIDERRGELETAPEPAPVPAPDPEVVELTGQEESYGGVRVIPAPADAEEPDTGPVGEPVETMDVVEEVRRLKEEPESAPEPEVEPPPTTEAQPAEVEPEVVPEPDSGTPEDGLSDLFASLRGGSEEPEAEEPEPAAEVEPQPEPLDPEPELRGQSTEPAFREDPAEVEKAVEQRDRRIIPITNGALRGVKRELADAQNESLEGIRKESDTWRPSRTELSEHLEPTLLLVRDSARRSGAEWAAERLGTDFTVSGSPDMGDSVMAGDLAASIERALDRGTDAAGKGAEVSRVFRSWRSDSAERHLRAEALKAFHRGIQEAVSAAGHDVAVHQSRACSTCAETVESGEVVLPPIHDGCSCILLPV